MAYENTVVIGISKSKLVLFLLGSLAFVCFGIWACSLDSATIEAARRFNNPVFVYGTGLLTIALFGFMSCSALVKLFDDSPGLIVDSKGITDNSSAISAGFIPWSEITHVSVGSEQGHTFLFIHLRDPKGFIATRPPLKRMLLRIFRRMKPSPISLTARLLKIGFSDLVTLVETRFAASVENA